jgi:hypothetical protein
MSKYIRFMLDKGFGGGNPRERDHWGEAGIDERIILRRIFRKWVVGLWTGYRIQTVGG